jgi:drug/metabolite transporter (DMT)-like permease
MDNLLGRVLYLLMNTSTDRRTLIALAVVLLFWSSAFAAIRAALVAYGPYELALLRFLTASAVLGIYALASKMRLPKLRDLPLIAVLGLLGITGYHLSLNVGEVTVTAGSALLAGFFLGERFRTIGWMGVGLSFLGVVLIAFGEGSDMRLETGALLILLAAVLTSIYSVLQKRFIERYSPLEFTTYVIWAGTLPMLIFLPRLITTIKVAPISATGAALYLGVFPAAIAYVLWVYALSRSPASNVTSFLYLNPVLAIVIAWLWLGEIPTWLSLLGGTLCIVGVLVTNIRKTPD